jgi:DNA-binding NtrC family response regulator
VTDEIVGEARAFGAFAVLEKPFDLHLLVETVRAAALGAQ